MTTLQEVTEKICKLLEKTDLHPIRPVVFDPMFDDPIGACPIELEKEIKPIREAEILAVLRNFKHFEQEYYMTAFGIETYKMGVVALWQLGKPLSEQSKETINFLHKILVR